MADKTFPVKYTPRVELKKNKTPTFHPPAMYQSKPEFSPPGVVSRIYGLDLSVYAPDQTPRGPHKEMHFTSEWKTKRGFHRGKS